jgi:hypothetical protein
VANLAPLGGIYREDVETREERMSEEEPISVWPDIRDENWKELIPRLLYFAELRLRRLRWQRGCIPGGRSAQDFVHDAIEKALSGNRKFNSTKDVLKNLCQIISGDISHQVMSYENRNVSSMNDSTDNLPDEEPSAESIVHYRCMCEKLLSYLDRDPVARIIAELMLYHDIVASYDLGIRLQLPISEIENAKKRLRRRCEEFKDQHDESTKRAA